MIIITMKTRLKADVRDEVLSALAKACETTRTEPGCIDYRFWTSAADANDLLLLEQWEDQAALDVHMAAPSLAAVGAALGPGIDGPVDAVKHEVSSFGPLFG
jgi:quinol monooxygenase YgiN